MRHFGPPDSTYYDGCFPSRQLSTHSHAMSYRMIASGPFFATKFFCHFCVQALSSVGHAFRSSVGADEEGDVDAAALSPIGGKRCSHCVDHFASCLPSTSMGSGGVALRSIPDASFYQFAAFESCLRLCRGLSFFWCRYSHAGFPNVVADGFARVGIETIFGTVELVVGK